MTEALVVLSTFPDEETAAAIAEALVQSGAAACVNLVPKVRSIYRWQGRLQNDSEVLAVIKTDRADYPALQAQLAALHPYDCPEILAIPVEFGSTSYLAWLTAHRSV